jgi:hypothetical protein
MNRFETTRLISPSIDGSDIQRSKGNLLDECCRDFLPYSSNVFGNGRSSREFRAICSLRISYTVSEMMIRPLLRKKASITVSASGEQ